MKRIKYWKKALLVLIDMGFINLAFYIAYAYRFQNNIPENYFILYLETIFITLGIFIASFFIFKLYESLWNYASIDEFLLAVGGCIVAGLINLIVTTVALKTISGSINIMATVLITLFVVGFRMCFRIYRRTLKIASSKECRQGKRVMIVGAGSGGCMIIKEMHNSKELKLNPICFIDDSKYKIGTSIAGVKVLGNRDDIKEIAEELKIDLIVIAIPTLEGKSKKELINICKETSCEVKIIPGIYELINGAATVSKIRNVEVEDLLGREEVKLSCMEISEYLKGKNVLVTGGGGSIGSELSRQIVKFLPQKLVILDIYENNAYDLQMELLQKYKDLNLKVIIASVRDKKRLDNIFREEKIDVVFHAAAHKHVPLMEENPEEAIKNNVFGTLNLAETADKYKVKRFVMISTDKAVNPTNIMGATKRACEMIIQAMDKRSSTEFVAVRFGNVLGSNGSVIPLFKRQIASGGPVTLTHKDITRYFMTIPEAAQLVLQAGAQAKGGEIFVLDMGSPVKIYNLAYDLIRLSGFEPNKDIMIEVTGLRPGEKLYEELLMSEEGLEDTENKKIFIGRPAFVDYENLQKHFNELKAQIEFGNRPGIFREMESLLTTYKRNIGDVEREVAAGRVEGIAK